MKRFAVDRKIQKQNKRGRRVFYVKEPVFGTSKVLYTKTGVISSKHNGSLSKRQLTYSGSPDSEVVAGYIGRFDYRPERRSQIRQKYENLVGRVYR